MARKLVVKRGRKAGSEPGTLIHIGSPRAQPPSIRVIEYDQHDMADRLIDTAGDYEVRQRGQVTWLNVDGVHQADVIEAVGQAFNLHPLVMEDILNVDQRPKVEDYDGYLYLVLRILRYDAASQEIQSEQVSLVLGEHFVLSLQEVKSEIFDAVRNRLRDGRQIRCMPADYLAYALLDAVVDQYFLALEELSEQIETLEDQLIENPQPANLRQIHHYKREMLILRKAVWPLREVLGRLSRDESPLISAETRVFLRDVYDHTIHVMDTIDTLRELLVGLLDLYLSSINNRMNEVMKVLTIIATLFMPLTFIAGVYGMNFELMPELEWRWGYPAVMALMLLISGSLLYSFRRRGWI
ncbi:magnesium/cobalt transporter CorA [Halopseudomonas pelagia]|uniref:Magnesium transport protein CorA n=1 Tax=Halopseudomonas pelagia TaxID=553151 RepID=A0AA91Z617_9GAMM|nr:magnesium/cobalt transporter CorA [Halopseudomonas pelagia]PCC99423.1 magnesium and cobalt transport protein CorA [Halopseudomonas pelagia]QFY57255.1 magnesium and cobalt transport protein CorA [Halopseudomonas pelagia]